MTWVKYWLKYADYDEIVAEATRRGIVTTSTIPPALIYGTIGGSDLAAILPQTYTVDGKQYQTRKYLWDREYALTTPEEVKRFLAWNMVDKRGYVDDKYDCDNFAISLYADFIEWTNGLCAGFFITTDHAKNLVVCSNKKVYEIEPQSDVMNELKSPCSLYMF